MDKKTIDNIVWQISFKPLRNSIRNYIIEKFNITNANYLTVEYLELFNTLGVNHIVMSYYYNYADQNIPFDIENIVKLGMLKLINKLNLCYKVLYQNYKAYSVEIKLFIKNIINQKLLYV